MRIWRIQDRFGRGPFRPALSKKWVDSTRNFDLQPIFIEIENFKQIVDGAHRSGLHLGCAVSSELFGEWFSEMEVKRLKRLGFSLVNATPCQVLARTPTQFLVASKAPMSKLTRIKWPKQVFA